MVEPSLYNLKNQGKNKGKTRNFVVKTRVFGKRTGFLKTRVFDEKGGLFLKKGRGF